MKPQEIYIGQKNFTKIKGICIAYKGDLYWRIRHKIIAEMETGKLSGTIGEKGWWIVKKEFRLNEWA